MDVRKGPGPAEIDDDLADDLEAFEDRPRRASRRGASLDGFSIAGITRRELGGMGVLGIGQLHGFVSHHSLP